MVMIKVKETSIVKPAEKTPRRRLWLSILDMMSNVNNHNPVIYFYRSNGASNFFDTNVVKQSLSKVLVPFYPMAGRLCLDGSGRIEVDCNEEGALFVTAETTSVIDDFGDFAPTPELRRLIPTVDYSLGISSFPLLLIQVTYFKCGGVSLGIGFDHHITDGPAGFYFINEWSNIARGLALTVLPFLDRTLLRPRNPPQPIFNHIEYQPRPDLKASHENQSAKVASFKITTEQLNRIKDKAREDGNTINYSTHEILSGHIWKSVCQAREQPDEQQTMLYFAVNGRYSRLQPPLPPGYFGNVIFSAPLVAKAGDLKTKPLSYAASCIHKILKRMDNEYLRSAIDYLELQPDVSSLRRGPHAFMYPNVGISNWAKLLSYDVDFGWGRPIYIGPGGNMFEGRSCIMPSPTNDGSLLVNIALRPEHIKAFEKLFYAYDEKKHLGKLMRANL